MEKKKFEKDTFFKYNSITTPDFCHSGSCLAAEIMVVRHACENGDTLVPYFWRKESLCKEMYKKEYAENIKCMRKMTKSVPIHFVIQCVTYAKKINYSNYGYIVATIAGKWEKWNNNMSDRINNIIREQASRNVAIEELLVFSSDVNYKYGDIKTEGRKKQVKM